MPHAFDVRLRISATAFLSSANAQSGLLPSFGGNLILSSGAGKRPLHRLNSYAWVRQSAPKSGPFAWFFLVARDVVRPLGLLFLLNFYDW